MKDCKLIAGMLMCMLHKATMTDAQLALYDAVSKTQADDAQKKVVTYIVPAGADSKDLEKVKRQIELESGGDAGWPVKFVTGGNSGGPSSNVQNDPKP